MHLIGYQGGRRQNGFRVWWWKCGMLVWSAVLHGVVHYIILYCIHYVLPTTTVHILKHKAELRYGCHPRGRGATNGMKYRKQVSGRRPREQLMIFCFLFFIIISLFCVSWRHTLYSSYPDLLSHLLIVHTAPDPSCVNKFYFNCRSFTLLGPAISYPFSVAVIVVVVVH